jgi:hypothetical protein
VAGTHAAAVLLAIVALAGCAGTSELLHHAAPPPPPKSHLGRIYLERLTAAQTQLTAAEGGIPRRPHTPVQLAHSISLLAGAMRGLAAGLTAIRPPSQVARLHRRLIAITVAYEQRLRRLGTQARSPTLEVAAANAMAAATDLASSSFTATSAAIRERLAH